MRQLKLFKVDPITHGGAIAKGKRKTRRPLCSKRVIHLTLKAHKNILYSHKGFIEEELRRLGKKFNLKIYSIAVNLDHLHIAVKISDRKSYLSFIRSFTGLVARELGKKLWALLPHTRLVSWGRAYKKLLQYLELNRKEASGQVPYTPREAHRRGMVWLRVPS